ncbi:MAG: hypothetical protein M5U19_20830 [Microthrixaceae bacterium]|nr:hypothetical protein [Microthrixaceae bacterium]
MITTARVLAGVDAKELSDEECLGMVDDIEVARRSLDATSAGVLAEVDRRGLCDIRYGTATGVWFERRHGRSRTAVNREIRAGRRLRADLGGLFAAVAAGEITFERAAFIAAWVNDRNADAFSAAQQALLAIVGRGAGMVTVHRVGRRSRPLRRCRRRSRPHRGGEGVDATQRR